MSFLKCKTYKGWHSEEAKELIEEAWQQEDLLLLSPPNLSDDFIRSLKLDNSLFPEKPIYAIFSTGTLGQKLIFYSKKNILTSLEGILSLFDLNEIEEVFCYPQPFHTFGLILGYCQSFLYEKSLVVPPGPYSSDSHPLWLSSPSFKRMTLGTPTHFKDLLTYTSKEGLTPKPTYTSIIGGAQVEKKLWKDIQQTLRIQKPSIGYGATEASPGVTHLAPGLAPKEDGEVGHLLPHVNMTLLEEGLEFSGPNVCLGIFEGTGLKFPSKIQLKDKLEKRDDGVFLYKGREELILNRGGEKFSLEAMERTLKKQLGVEAVCFSLPHSRLSEELGILVEGHKPRNIYEVLKTEFGRDFDPKNLFSVSKLPLNASSKIDRRKSREILIGNLHAHP